MHRGNGAAMMVPRLFLAWLLVAPAIASAQDPAANVDVREVAAITGRIDRVDPFARTMILQTADGMLHSVVVRRGLKVFDTLRAGDTVTIRTSESVTVVPKPRAKTTVVEDQTAAANKSAAGAGADVIQRLKAIVIVEQVDPLAQTIAYKGADNRSVTRMVGNRRLLDGLKPGDIVEIVYSRERTIETAHQP